MLEAVFRIGALVLGCVGAVSVVRELVLYRRLSGALREWPGRLPIEVPRLTDAGRLEGLEGQRGGVCYRWDAERRTLRFRRLFPQIRRYYVCGSLRFDADGEARLAYRPVPVGAFLSGAVLAPWGVAGLALSDGFWPALLAAPLTPLIFLLAWLGYRAGTRKVLEHDVLPVLVEVIRGRVG